jgi:hypothetical protein
MLLVCCFGMIFFPKIKRKNLSEDFSAETKFYKIDPRGKKVELKGTNRRRTFEREPDEKKEWLADRDHQRDQNRNFSPLQQRRREEGGGGRIEANII